LLVARKERKGIQCVKLAKLMRKWYYYGPEGFYEIRATSNEQRM